jgi:DNA-binding NtrC family response regulator
MKSLERVLIIDDEESMRRMLRLVLQREGYLVEEAGSGKAGLDLLRERPTDLVLCDIRMPEMDGIEFLGELQQRNIATTVIMMSAYGSIDTAVECLKRGAYDYVSKPFKPDEIMLALRKAEERLRLLQENALLKKKLDKSGSIDDLVYASRSISALVEQVRRVAEAMSPVLVTGETGTGKELIAKALHFSGPRRGGPFLAVNCSAIAANLLESELFGHAKGAFTGADRARDGLFLAASGGTLFLDEIGELPLELQPKLLRVLQENEVRRVGESKSRKLDVRIVAATARTLKDEVEKRCFRDDLFYRLAVVELVVPPLRERPEDIPLLAKHFVSAISARERRPVPTLEQDALEALQGYHWPGNVRELENFMEKTMIFCREQSISLATLPWEMRREQRSHDAPFSLKQAGTRLEQEYIRKALAATGGNRTQAARKLEISLRALLYKMKEFNIS